MTAAIKHAITASFLDRVFPLLFVNFSDFLDTRFPAFHFMTRVSMATFVE